MLRTAFAATGGEMCDVRRAALKRCGAGSMCGGAAAGGHGVALMLESNWAAEGDGDEQDIHATDTSGDGSFIAAAVVLAMDLSQLEPPNEFLNVAEDSCEQVSRQLI